MIEAVADRLEGAPRQLRRRWSDEFKAQVVMEALEPGASVSAIARRIGIHPSQLFAWRRDARAERRRYRSRHPSCEGAKINLDQSSTRGRYGAHPTVTRKQKLRSFLHLRSDDLHRRKRWYDLLSVLVDAR
ncbi:transposase [Bradyrhizobium sp. USDA 4529]